jgi:type VI secretion system FHA domain protein
MNVTTIQPVENNPLKFSANLEEAIENMFVKEGNAYKKPVEAIREGFQSITEHQLAVLAGIRAAFTGGIERFNPDALERRFSKYQKSGLIQMGKKGKNWDFYRDYYRELVSDMDGSFRHLFGDEFVQAYEDQLHRLSLSRKKRR